jgi:hypothetical protein
MAATKRIFRTNIREAMTPREKAKELISKYYLPHPFQKLTKNFALIAVEEIIEEIASLWGGKEIAPSSVIEYWYEVKQEIKNYEHN